MLLKVLIVCDQIGEHQSSNIGADSPLAMVEISRQTHHVEDQVESNVQFYFLTNKMGDEMII